LDQVRAAAVLSEAGYAVHLDGDHLVVRWVADPAGITQILATQQIWVAELTPLVPDLESVFLELTGTRPRDGRPRQVDQAVLPEASP
jgi:ABC-2 type transport system ATP-binding protein